MKDVRKIEKSISNIGVIGALVGFPVAVVFSIILSNVLGIDPDGCVKCQKYGDIWFFSFVLSICVFGYLGYQLGIRIKIKLLLKSGVITKSELSGMNFKKSLYRHEL